MALRRPTPSAKPGRKGRADLTEEQKQEIKEAFDLFDTDGSGKQNKLIIIFQNHYRFSIFYYVYII